MRHTSDAVPILGAAGAIRGLAGGALGRAAKIPQIGAGADQIQRNAIARHGLGR